VHPVDVWIRTLRDVRAKGDVADAGAQVLARYTEHHRAYHTAAHLADVLDAVDELADVATDPAAVRLAALFHDAVYDPLRTDNEERSAELAETTLARLRVDDARVAAVARLVRLTAGHDPGEDDRDGAVLCDADLRVLAREGAAYDDYVAAVRHEYAALDEAAWRRDRAAVLRGLLARPALFRTSRYHARYEAAARANLSAELAALTSGEAPGDDAGPPPPGGSRAPGT
jgi:predicted metal-dependent HD superfamily phosphohydrolase